MTLAGRDLVACGEWPGDPCWQWHTCFNVCVFARGVSPGFGGCGVPREQTLPAVLRISFLWGWC